MASNIHVSQRAALIYGANKLVSGAEPQPAARATEICGGNTSGTARKHSSVSHRCIQHAYCWICACCFDIYEVLKKHFPYLFVVDVKGRVSHFFLIYFCIIARHLTPQICVTQQTQFQQNRCRINI